MAAERAVRRALGAVRGAPTRRTTDAPDEPLTDQPDGGRRRRRSEKERGRRDRRQRRAGRSGVEELLAAGHDRRVLVLADADQRRELLPWLDRCSSDRICVISADEAPEWELADRGIQHRTCPDMRSLVRQVRMLDAPHVVVSLLPTDRLPRGADDQLDLFAALFRYLRQDGTYLLDRQAAGPRLNGLSRWLELLAGAEDASVRASQTPTERQLVAAVGTLVVSREAIAVTKRTDQYVKLRESDLDQVLPAREPDVQLSVLERRPGGEFESRARVVSHASAHDPSLPELIRYPELTTRHYTGPIASAGGTLLYTGQTILPDSFRWHLTENPTNPRLTSESRRFARIPSERRPRRTMPGSYYQLDNTFPHHFGHLMTEVVSRLWGWDSARREIPDLKALLHLKRHSRRDPVLERTLFAAYGIPEADIVWTNEPVWLESVVSASPMWQNAEPHFAHPGLTETWERLGDGLAGGLSRSPHERIFVSRGSGAKHRECRNAPEVEKLFADRGYHVVYPELLPLPQQVAVFRDAKVVAGFGGSAMFNLMFSRAPETVVVLNHEAYTARNEHLFTSLTGGNVHYFWSRPDVPHPEGGWSDEAFASAWTFDFERNAESLAEVLANA